jgi:hypothetical protein
MDRDRIGVDGAQYHAPDVEEVRGAPAVVNVVLRMALNGCVQQTVVATLIPIR